MEAGTGEARRHARELHRRAQKRLAQCGAVRRVVVFGAVRIAPEERLERLAAVIEHGSDDAPGADGLAVNVAHFVDDGEVIAALDVLVEVDVAGEHVGELERHRIGQPRDVGGGEERRADFAGCELAPHFDRRRPRGRVEAIAIARDREQLPAARNETQLQQRALVAGLYHQRLAGSQLIERPCRGIVAQKRERIRIVDAQTRQHAAHRVAAADALLAPIARFIGGERRPHRLRQRAQHRHHGDRFERRVRCNTECGDARKRERDETEPLPECQRARRPDGGVNKALR